MMVIVYENTQNGDLGLSVVSVCLFTDVCSTFSSFHIGIKVAVIS